MRRSGCRDRRSPEPARSMQARHHGHPLRRHRQPAQGVPPRLRACPPTRSPTGSAFRAPRSTASRRASWRRSRRWRSSPSLLGVSIPTLLGVGVEYIASAVAYFERMRQIEETCRAHHRAGGADLLSARLRGVRSRRSSEVLRESIPEGSRRPASARSRRSTRSWRCCASARRATARASPASSI